MVEFGFYMSEILLLSWLTCNHIVMFMLQVYFSFLFLNYFASSRGGEGVPLVLNGELPDFFGSRITIAR